MVEILTICEQKLVKILDDLEPVEDTDYEHARHLESKVWRCSCI